MKKDETNYPSYPEPFKIMDGCLYREVQSRNGSYDQKLCNFLPYIISEVTVDDGAEEVKRLRLGGIRQNGSCLSEIDVTGNELGSFNWLIEKWGADCILEIGSTVKDSVRYAIQQTAHHADRCTVYQVTGWKKIAGRWTYLMPGKEPPSVQLPDKLSRYEGAEEIDPDALPVLAYLLEHPPAPREVIWPLLAFTFLTPLNHFLHAANCEPKFVFLLQGRTGARKSSLAALFLSFFGCFTASDLPLSFRDTANSIIHNAFTLKDVLTCIDDFHPCGRQEEQKLTATAQSIIRAYGDRVGRGRLRPDASAMAVRPPQGNAIITAEFPPEVGESGSARCFAVELEQDAVNLNELSFFQERAASGILRGCMLGYTQWLWGKFLADEEREKRFVSVLHSTFENYRNDFLRTRIRCHGRLPEIVAWLRIGMTMLLLYLEEREQLSQERSEKLLEEFVSLLYDMARSQARSNDQDKPALIFVRKLVSLIESGQAVLVKKDAKTSFLPKDCIGYEDEEYYYLFNDQAHRAVRKLCEDQGEAFTIHSRSLPKALAEEGLIEPANGENTRSIRFVNGTRRVLCLSKDRVRSTIDEDME